MYAALLGIIHSEVFQGIVLAFCTWYIRNGSKKDTAKAAATVVNGTASQTTSDEIRAKVDEIEKQVALLMKDALKRDPTLTLDDRGPDKSKE